MAHAIQFRLAAPLVLPNRKGIAQHRAAGAAQVKRERVILASEIMVLTAGQRPATPLRFASVSVFRRSVAEPDTDNLYASLKPLLDVLQPSGDRRVYGLGIIANDKPSACWINVHHVPVNRRNEQCTMVVIRELTASTLAELRADARRRATGEAA
jgi:hypothetical protein